MKFRDYFSNTFHTAEDHYINSLRTRYYRATLSSALEAVKEIGKRYKGVFKPTDEARGELFFEASNFNANVTLVSTSYTETAVDFIITTYGFLPFGKGKKIIEELYQELDNKLPFKGVSLYKG